jgi:pimeloyl-ACP methyl ester carboxylesterase
MPFATNPLDGCRTYFEDDEGDGPSVVLLNGLGDPIVASRAWGVSQRLAGACRMLYVDQRGHGRSDKPHDASAYAMRLCTADVLAVLDASRVDRAHLIGLSWGARLLFAFVGRFPERVQSATFGGQSPFAFNPDSPGVRTVSGAFDRGRSMADFVEALGGFGGMDDQTKRWTLENDFEALAAAWRAALAEGGVAAGMPGWRFPCLVYAGSEDVDFFQDARRAASLIPGATFVSLEGQGHLEAHANVDGILPHIEKLILGTGG